jgi:hypothetical protein
VRNSPSSATSTSSFRALSTWWLPSRPPGRTGWTASITSSRLHLANAFIRTENLPGWLADKPNYGVWQRSNIRMLNNALSIGDTDTTLIAFWDGEGGDGPGGTEHMVRSVRERGARAIVLDTKQLFGL